MLNIKSLSFFIILFLQTQCQIIFTDDFKNIECNIYDLSVQKNIDALHFDFNYTIFSSELDLCSDIDLQNSKRLSGNSTINTDIILSTFEQCDLSIKISNAKKIGASIIILISTNGINDGLVETINTKNFSNINIFFIMTGCEQDFSNTKSLRIKSISPINYFSTTPNIILSIIFSLWNLILLLLSIKIYYNAHQNKKIGIKYSFIFEIISTIFKFIFTLEPVASGWISLYLFRYVLTSISYIICAMPFIIIQTQILLIKLESRIVPIVENKIKIQILITICINVVVFLLVTSLAIVYGSKNNKNLLSGIFIILLNIMLMFLLILITIFIKCKPKNKNIIVMSAGSTTTSELFAGINKNLRLTSAEKILFVIVGFMITILSLFLRLNYGSNKSHYLVIMADIFMILGFEISSSVIVWAYFI